MQKTIYFDSLECKPYNQPIGCPDISEACDELKKLIIQNNYSSIDDIVVEVADCNIDIYTYDLINNCNTPAFVSVLNSTINEFGTFDDIEQLYRAAEYLYYYNALYDNLEAICQNAIIDYMSRKAITITADDTHLQTFKDKIEAAVINIINNTKPDDSVIDTFITDITSCIDLIANENEKIKLTDNDDDEPNGLTALYIEVGKKPRIVHLPISTGERLDELQVMVGGLIDIISLNSNGNIGIDMVINDEGKLLALPPNIKLKEKHYIGNDSERIVDVVMGNAVIVGVDLTDGEPISLPDEAIAYWSEAFDDRLVSLGSLYLDNEYNEKIFADFDEVAKNYTLTPEQLEL